MSRGEIANVEREATEPRRAGLRRRRVLRAVLYVVGLVLLAAAVWVVVDQRENMSRSVDALCGAPWVTVALVLAAPAVHWLFSTLIFWVLLNRYGMVGRREMAALMAAGALLNQLPMRAGMLGRLAYHRLVNNISAIQVGRSVLDSIICSAAAFGVSLLVVVAFIARGKDSADHDGWAAPLIVSMLGGVGLLSSLVVRRATSGLDGEPAGHLWRYICGGSLRLLDGVAWAVRYWLVFGMLQTPISPTGAMAVAVVSQATGLLPVPLGLREWAVGLTSSVLPSSGTGEAAKGGGVLGGVVRSGGLQADIFMRVTELVWTVPMGAVSFYWLWRRYRRSGIQQVRSQTGPTADITG